MKSDGIPGGILKKMFERISGDIVEGSPEEKHHENLKKNPRKIQ